MLVCLCVCVCSLTHPKRLTLMSWNFEGWFQAISDPNSANSSPENWKKLERVRWCISTQIYYSYHSIFPLRCEVLRLLSLLIIVTLSIFLPMKQFSFIRTPCIYCSWTGGWIDMKFFRISLSYLNKLSGKLTERIKFKYMGIF